MSAIYQDALHSGSDCVDAAGANSAEQLVSNKKQTGRAAGNAIDRVSLRR
jgi:hypothetical protein